MTPQAQPSLFIPHGGGPCFFMADPANVWGGMADFLRALPTRLPDVPKAILIVSGHWETEGFVFTGAAKPTLLYDYFGFPAETYTIRYDAPGAPALAAKAAALLAKAGLRADVDPERGLDHGVFVPLKVAFPAADIPVIEMSLDRGLDPETHLTAGRALAPLRAEGVLIIGAGMSFHNMRGFNDPRFAAESRQFDDWLASSVALDGRQRAERLTAWEAAPGARGAHPEAEHLLPLMVAAGAAEGPGDRIYKGHVLKAVVSAYQFT